jgi:hypothetical protein
VQTAFSLARLGAGQWSVADPLRRGAHAKEQGKAQDPSALSPDIETHLPKDNAYKIDNLLC